MSSAHLVDEELGVALAALPAITMNEETLAAVRAPGGAFAMGQPDPTLPVEVATIQVPGLGGAPDVRMLVYRPTDATTRLPAILQIHGGGYVMGDPGMMDASNRLHAARLGCAVYAVDYRLAPEAPHPAPVEDCYAALLWLFANADAQGIDAARIGIKGESAGGGLAAATALLARDRGQVSLAFQHLHCPMLDDRTATRTDISPALGEYVWTRESNVFGWRSLLGREPGGADVSAYASPARAENLAGLPRTFINVGALDLFLDEDVDYARRLAHAGVPVELHVYPGAFHGFEAAPESRVARAALRDSMDALRRAMHRKVEPTQEKGQP